MACLYPLAKRYTHYAQTVLGTCFNSGIFIGAAQIMGDAFTLTTCAQLAPFYIGSILWTMIYDSVYAYNDRNDDIKQNLKGLGVLWGDKIIENCKKLNIVQTALFMTSGYLCGINHIEIFLASGVMIALMLKTVNLNDPQSCQNFFIRSRYFGLMIGGIILGNLWLMSLTQTNEKITEKVNL